MRKAPVFLLAISLAALLAGCAGQTVPLGGAQISALSATAATTATVTDEKRDVPVSADTSDVENPAGPAENVKPQENAQQPESKADASESPVPAGEEQPDVPEQPTTPEQPVTPEPEPVPVPAPTPAEGQEQPVQEIAPEPAPKPAASGNIYSIAEAVRVGNEYARAQYGVTIDTSMTAADSSYFPGTADSVAWLTENGGQTALTAAVKGNVDATFACLAAMDGAETVSAFARFNCTARYDATSDKYIVVVLYG